MRIICRLTLIACLALATASAAAAPVGYSVNSDEPLGDSLYVIDLTSGEATFIGEVLSPLGVTRTDVEGLAFDPGGTLWAVDDESGMLFPVSQSTGLVQADQEAAITGIGATQRNDFGMTFTCTGELFVTSVENQSLYSLALNGVATLKGSLGARISSLAAYGNPARLYGLGNGLISEGGPQDNRSLYEIDPETGHATLIGPIGDHVADYFEAGLSFSEDGLLWAITDRRTADQALGSQILLLDTETGMATHVSTTTVSGFESLAVAPPGGCEQNPATRELPIIPALGAYGMLLAFLVLLVTGMTALSRARG
jgi:hypothetical protein